MERFIRYFYEYKQDKRIRNVGFVKVEAGSEETMLHMQGKGFQSKEDRQLIIYLLYKDGKEILRIRQAEVCLMSPVFNYHHTYTINSVENPENYEKICGILIETGQGRKIVATWDDGCVDVSRVIEYDVESLGAARNIVQVETVEDNTQMLKTEDDMQKPEAGENEIQISGESREKEVKEQWEMKKTLTRITRQDISKLPHCEWKLANNQFLMHGYRNFHHLLLIDGGIYLKLGVPGIYHIKEAKCAKDFGFEEFLSAEELGISEDQGNDQEELFGYWCRPVKRRFRRQE